MKIVGQTINDWGEIITVYECPHCHWRTTGIKCLQDCELKERIKEEKIEHGFY